MKTLVVSILAPCKEYCLPELLESLAALEGVDRYLLAVDGDLSIDGEREVVQWSWKIGRVTLETLRIPPSQYFLYRCGQLRQAAWEVFRGMQFGQVLWLDADVLAAPDTIRRLEAHQAPLVSGLLMHRIGPTPLLANPGQVLQPGLQETEGGSYGCLLVDEKLARGAGWTEYLTFLPKNAPGEDVWWFTSVRTRHGIRLLLDATVAPWHVDKTGIAGRAAFAPSGHLKREVIVKIKRTSEYTGHVLLVPWADGQSPRFGRLIAGEPITHHADGTLLSDEEKRSYAEQSSVLDLVEIDLPDSPASPAEEA